MAKSVESSFRKGALLSRAGGVELYAGVQMLGGGLERPVLIRLLRGRNVEDEAGLERSIQRVNLLLELAKARAVKCVYDFGIDEDNVLWIVTEPADGTLRDRIGSEPAEPETVRQAMSQMLRALIHLHEHRPAVTCNTLNPDGIEMTGDGWWVLDEDCVDDGWWERTSLEQMPVQYCAPEVLDPERGKAGPASDLYALGMSLYELSLGRALFRRQFPSVYEDQAGGAGGEVAAEKWLYWQVSPQLELPPVRELRPDFPADLSENIARMLVKSPESRASSARALFEGMSRREVVQTMHAGKTQEREKAALTPMAKLLLAVILLAALAGLGLYAASGIKKSAFIALAETRVETDDDYVRVSGVAGNMPAGTRLVISARRNLLVERTVANVDSATGRFSAQLKTPELGEYIGFCGVLDEDENVFTQAVFSISRVPPDMVRVTFVTSPAAFGADITVVPGGAAAAAGKNTPQSFQADAEGRAVLNLPYGEYSVVVDHPRYKVLRVSVQTGVERLTERMLVLQPLEQTVLDNKRRNLTQEYRSLQKQAAAGDAEAIVEMASIQKELAQLADPAEQNATPERKKLAQKKLALLAQAAKLVGADNQSPEEAQQLAVINRQLAEIDEADVREELKAIARQRKHLQALAAGGDLKAAADLKKLDNRLQAGGIIPDKVEEYAEGLRALPAGASSADLTGNEGVQDGSPTAGSGAVPGDSQDPSRGVVVAGKVVQSAGVSAAAAGDRAAAADTAAAMAVAAACAAATTPEEKAAAAAAAQNAAEEIDQKVQRLQAAAAAGDPGAVEQIRQLQRRKEILSALAEGSVSGLEAQALLGREQTLGELPAAAVQGLSLAALRQYVRDLLPRRAIDVSEDGVQNKLVITGVTLDEESRLLLLTRLLPAAGRIAVDLRVDPSALVNGLQETLSNEGISQARVHPFLVGPTHRLFIGLPPYAEDVTLVRARILGEEYVAPQQLTLVRRLPYTGAPQQKEATQ